MKTVRTILRTVYLILYFAYRHSFRSGDPKSFLKMLKTAIKIYVFNQ